jgi:sugar/nucleoside kinase (ribokinase family)
MAAPEIVGIGCASVDDLVYIERNPGPDGKSPVQRRERAYGGLIGTALVAAARLGARCAYAGRLGDEEMCRAVEANFVRLGVDVSHAPRSPEARVVHSTIVVAASPPSRAIFFQCDGAIGPADDAPGESVIDGAKVLMVDHYNPVGTLRSCRIARRRGVAVVGDFEGAWAELPPVLDEVDHLVLSHDAAERLSGKKRPDDILAALWTPRRAVVAFTMGSEGCWWRDASGTARHQPAFPVEVADTTGCGDVFHGAYAVGLARGWDAPTRIRAASAAAALKATRRGGQAGCPSASELEAFLAARSTATSAR